MPGYVLEPWDWIPNIAGAIEREAEEREKNILRSVLNAYEFLKIVFKNERKLGVWVDIVLLVSILMRDVLGTVLGPVEVRFEKKPNSKKEEKNQRVVQLAIRNTNPSDEIVTALESPGVVIIVDEEFEGKERGIVMKYQSKLLDSVEWKRGVELGPRLVTTMDTLFAKAARDGDAPDAVQWNTVRFKDEKEMGQNGRRPNMAAGPICKLSSYVLSVQMAIVVWHHYVFGLTGCVCFFV